jgi:RNA polymerase sigma-B factor
MLDSSFATTAPLQGDSFRLVDAPAATPRTDRSDSDHDLIINNMGLAEAIARRYSRGASDPRDIRQVALLGLVKAARRFDPDRGFPFSAFAGPTIAGEIKRYLRDTAWLVRPPRSVQELALTTATAVPELEQEIGRQPSPSEIALHLSRDVGDVREALAGAHGMFATSLDGLVEENVAALADSADPAETVERALELHDAMRHLPQRDRVMLYMRFFEGRNQREIATELGMSQMQVSRALAKAFQSIRADLEAAEPAPQLERSA